MLRRYWYVLAACGVLALFALLWLGQSAPESLVLDTSSGREGSQFTMTVPKGSVVGSITAVFTDQSGLKYTAKAEIVGVDGDTRKLRVTVPTGICGAIKLSSRTVAVQIVNEDGKPAPGAKTHSFTVQCR